MGVTTSVLLAILTAPVLDSPSDATAKAPVQLTFRYKQERKPPLRDYGVLMGIGALQL